MSKRDLASEREPSFPLAANFGRRFRVVLAPIVAHFFLFAFFVFFSTLFFLVFVVVFRYCLFMIARRLLKSAGLFLNDVPRIKEAVYSPLRAFGPQRERV